MSYFFRYLTPKEKFMRLIAIIASAIAGVLMPAVAIFMGEIINAFDPSQKSNILPEMGKIAIYLTIIGALSWVFTYLYYAFW